MPCCVGSPPASCNMSQSLTGTTTTLPELCCRACCTTSSFSTLAMLHVEYTSLPPGFKALRPASSSCTGSKHRQHGHWHHICVGQLQQVRCYQCNINDFPLPKLRCTTHKVVCMKSRLLPKRVQKQVHRTCSIPHVCPLLTPTLSCSAAILLHCSLLQLLLLTTPPASRAAATTWRSEVQGASSSTRSYSPPSNLGTHTHTATHIACLYQACLLAESSCLCKIRWWPVCIVAAIAVTAPSNSRHHLTVFHLTAFH